MAGRILGKIEEIYWNSVPAWVSPILVCIIESPFKKSDLLVIPIFIVSELFLRWAIYLILFVFWAF
jgi:hypothetical protein